MTMLGPFRIESEIARGGMGCVYAARHVVEDYRAAVKVVPRAPRTRDLFLAEIRTTAALNHPSIVPIYDYGEVTELEASASEGQFHAGGVWFAMELASHGTLESTARPRSWSELQRLLLEILDALAHAHARGCVHRDLKPANVLIADGQGPRFILADFGIAHVEQPEGVLPETTDNITAPAAGTPMYMAPEQIHGRWRDQGPWTDLYALGCMAWELTTGALPFTGAAAVEIAMAHLTADLPQFAPRFSVPAEFESWLRTTLRKEWRSRFERAADAATILASMPATPDDAVPDVAVLSMPTLDSLPTIRLPSLQLQAIRKADANAQRIAPPRSKMCDWRPARETRAVRSRTGLGLFGLRDIGVQGRQTERDLLWETLQRASAEHSTNVCLLEGTEGRGKSRLLRWLGVRADELGAATVLHAGHARMVSPSSGLAFAIARLLRCVGLDEASTRERVASLYAGDADALASLLVPGSTSRGARRFGSPGERYQVMLDFLAEQCAHRHVLVLVDDAQWGPDSIGFVNFLLDRDPDIPISIVIAVDPAELDENPLARRRLDALRQSARCSRVVLDAMQRDEHVALVREQAGLAESLCEDLTSMSGGDTNYSVCVLGDWVERSALRPGPHGYVLRPDVDAGFPRDVREAWGARIDRFCARFAVPGQVEETLYVAAALGAEVDETEWRAACAHRGIEPKPRLVAQLVDAGIASLRETGFEFAQGAICEVLIDRADRLGLLPSIHITCAQVIRQPGSNGAAIAERRAHHLVRAGERVAALRQIEEAMDVRMETSAYEEAIALADLYLSIADDPKSEASLIIRARRADAHRFCGARDLAEQEANAILQLAAAISSSRARGEGLRVVAGLEHARGDLENGITNYTAAMDAFREAGYELGVAKSVHGRAWLYLNQSNLEQAARDFRLGVELAKRRGAEADEAWSSQGVAETAALRGELEVAESAARHAIAIFDDLGSRSGHGMATASLANVLAAQGRLDEARAASDAAIDSLSSFQSPLIAFAVGHRVALEAAHGTAEDVTRIVERGSDAPLTATMRLGVALARVLAGQHAFDDVAHYWAYESARRHPLVVRLIQLAQARLSDDRREQLNQVIVE